MEVKGVRKHISDRWIMVLTFVLMAIGLVVIYSIGPMRANYMTAAYGVEVEENSFFIHQLISVAFAVLAFFVAFFVPYDFLRKLSVWVLVGGILACLLLQIFVWAGSGMAVCENGACRWIKISSSLSIQPAEILKLGFAMYFGQLTARYKKEGRLESKDYFLAVGLLGVVPLVMVAWWQSDLATTVVLAMILLAIMFAGGLKMKYFAIVVGLAVAAAGVLIIVEPYRLSRLFTFLNTEDADTYHIDNALLAIGTGGLTGVGIGNTVQATGYLPESINDSVFAAMGEAFGFLGLILVVGCFVFLLMRILKVYEKRCDDEKGLVAVGIFAWVAVQVVINICAITGLIPLTGITLPLLSYGGTSMMFVAAGIGLVAQMSCYTRRGNEEKKPTVSQRGIR